MQLKQFVQKLPHMQHAKLSLSKREKCGEGVKKRVEGRGWESGGGVMVGDVELLIGLHVISVILFTRHHNSGAH